MKTRLEALAETLGRLLVPLTWANLVANIGIVVTGGAVRLTDSGLGCPDWPTCDADRWTNHPELGLHGYIEFGNRLLTYVLAAIAIACWVAARRRRAEHPHAVWLATVVALGVPFQAIIGGITVLTDLNPWIVSLHLLLSMAMIAVCVALVDHVSGPQRPAAGRTASRTTLAAFVVGWVVLYLGTVVTGSGPHAGDAEAPRNGLDSQFLSHVHAWSVYVLIGLTVLLCWLARRTAHAVLLRAALLLLAVEAAQGVIGFWQYFTDLPELLVGVHMLGAALTSAALAWAVVAARGRAAPAPEDAAAGPSAEPLGMLSR
ncbi:COX15/CtaA family protein [Nocardioides faecalis]|uniref:COX15/CtaA family protein n=1 Tax=Nocardioides faecalis TaxID=2803858 RepID=UPI0027DB0462|nr:COX15/CtaA family protein [Nocardioides faecalis]